jgi:Ca-activated chloride channel family protein
MSFLHPEFLYYLLPPMIILFVLLLTQKSTQESYFSEEVMEKLRVSANTLTLQSRNGIFFLIGILMVMALSGPVINEGTVEVKAKSADIMIALDISDSMLAEDVYPNRLKFAKQKALDLLKLAPDERMGVIGFAKNSYLVSPLSFDANAVAFLLRSLNTDSITEKGTNFLSMLEVVSKSIKNKNKKYLLILSDGGDSKDFSKEIAFAKEHKIVVFVLGIGTDKGAPIKKEDGSFIKQNGKIIISKLNDGISKLATSTGGVYIKSVNSRADIKAMLREIKAHSEKKELKSQEIKRYIPLFYYPLGLALFLLLIATSSISKREKLNLPALFLLGIMFISTPKAEAGLLDFMELKKADEAYKSGEYKKANEIYKHYEIGSKKAQTHYNIGNTLYKQGKYKEAVKSYEQAFFHKKSEKAANYANLGNAYAKAKEKKHLQKAIKAYEESLKLEEDKDVRENLEAVKKELKKQKKKQEKQKDKNSKKDKNKKNKNKDKKKQEQKDKKKSDKQDKKSPKDDKSDKKGDKEKEQEKQKKKESDSKDKNKKDKQRKKEEQKKNKTKELKENNTTAKQQASADMKDKMSEAEEKKWLKQLNKSQSTFLYKLNKQNRFKEQTDEKPW